MDRPTLERPQAEIDVHEVLSRARELAGERDRQSWTLDSEKRRALALLEAEIGRQEAQVALAKAEAENHNATAQARLVTAHHLPELAAAVGARFGEVKVTQIGAGDNPFGSIAQAVAGVLELARDV